MSSFVRENGFLVIETPNAEDALLSIYKSGSFSEFTYWSHHPSLCTNRYLEEALIDAGFEILQNTQLQRYSIANHLHWLAFGEPGGHKKELQELFSTKTVQQYADDLVSIGAADTIWIAARPKMKIS